MDIQLYCVGIRNRVSDHLFILQMLILITLILRFRPINVPIWPNLVLLNSHFTLMSIFFMLKSIPFFYLYSSRNLTPLFKNVITHQLSSSTNTRGSVCQRILFTLCLLYVLFMNLVWIYSFCQHLWLCYKVECKHTQLCINLKIILFAVQEMRKKLLCASRI